MRFVDLSDEGSLDSGDALNCINSGIDTITTALATLRGKPTPEQIAGVLVDLDEWRTSARALIAYTTPEEEDDEDTDDLEDEYADDEDEP